MLDVKSLTGGYAGALAIEDITFSLGASESLALLGRNGAGKTTTLKTLMGLLAPWSGGIEFKGAAITGQSSDRIAHAGIGYVPEERRIFESLSVTENLVAGEKPGRSGRIDWTVERVFGLFPEIARRSAAQAGTLSGGERQMLAIGRALMGNPELLLLDEPSEGLAPVVVNRLGDALAALRSDGIAILISEQNRNLARRVAENLVILETGRVAYRGNFSGLDGDPAIATRLLGV
ncbi:MAG: ABC transporter ATP-binding protein [Rhodospirillales bacterium]|nr:ABC transporter ATP-binding protein [Rhodospirillales bacterium]MBO6785453.1 ABC transporter ATP-binding protein [Rhodospirillales bacterium]